MARALEVRRLGRIQYDEAMAEMERLAEARVAGDVPDTILLLEHEPVITRGRRSDPENLLLTEDALAGRGIALRTTARGGDVTFHGPGQLVAYPVLDLRPERCDVRRYVTDLEQVMIDVVSRYGLTAGRVAGQNGAWIDGARKIGAVGVRIARWVTSHGFALNVCTDLSSFEVIIPCGIRGKGVTSISKEVGREVSLEEVSDVAEEVLRRTFSRPA